MHCILLCHYYLTALLKDYCEKGGWFGVVKNLAYDVHYSNLYHSLAYLVGAVLLVPTDYEDIDNERILVL